MIPLPKSSTNPNFLALLNSVWNIKNWCIIGTDFISPNLPVGYTWYKQDCATMLDIALRNDLIAQFQPYKEESFWAEVCMSKWHCSDMK